MADATSRYRVVPAQPSQLAALPAIERAAGRLFDGQDLGLPPEAFDEVTPLEDFAEAQAEGLLLVALDGNEAPVGFALADERDDALHLEEVDVHPDHGRRGLGEKLVRALCALSVERGPGAVTLTTFRDVPWNRPFYERLGFAVQDPASLPAELREIVAEEAERGLDPARRVVMRWRATSRDR